VVHVHYDIFFGYTPFPESLIFICASCEKMDSIWGSSIHFHREEYICPFGFPTMGRIIETDIPASKDISSYTRF